ncbi:hypothetical protein QL285_069767 [Trifolium repens]|nr:hypothetical protein QL285_069767 [Trifolium repens]
MDRSWMKAYRLSPEYERGVMEFLQFAEENLPPPQSNVGENLPPLFLCPCVFCANQVPKLNKEEIKCHLICDGICQNYTQWIWHGEVVARPSVSQRENVSVDMDDRLEDMMRDIGEDSFKRAHVYDTLCDDKDKPLYPGCTNFTRFIERYIADTLQKKLLSFVQTICQKWMLGVPKSRHDGRCDGAGTQGLNVKSMNIEVVLQAHLYILNNTDEVQPYLSAHKSIIKKKNAKMNENWLLKEHNKSFSEWFKERVANDGSDSNTIKWLSYGPKCNVTTWSAYDINKTSFYTKSKDVRSTMQNSGVMIVAESMHFSSSKDKNPVMASTPYYGVIEEIWEVDYVVFKVPLFKCKWVDINSGVRIDELGFTLLLQTIPSKPSTQPRIKIDYQNQLGEKFILWNQTQNRSRREIYCQNRSQKRNHVSLCASSTTRTASLVFNFRYLYDKLIGPRGLTHKISFLSPHVSYSDIQGNDIASRLMETKVLKDEKIILAPYNIGIHWVLFVINPNAEDIYFLDPLGGEPSDHGSIKTKFENAIQIYRAWCENKISKSKKDKIKWHKIKCPRQTNTIDCGYFIMRFMKEVIMEYPNKIPDNYFHRHRHSTYSKEKLDEVKEEWATYMVEDVINDAKRRPK